MSLKKPNRPSPCLPLRLPRPRTIHFAIAGTMLLVGCAPKARGPAHSPTDDPIPLRVVHERGITGSLGERLGRVVMIRGVAVNGSTLNIKAADGNTYVRVDHVDDRALPEPMLIELRLHPF